MGKVLGGECKVYQCSTALAAVPGTSAFPTGTWTDYNKIISTSIDDNMESADASDRTSLIDQERAIGRKIQIKVKIHKDAADTQYLAFRTAYIGKSTITLAFTSGDKTVFPFEGFAANWNIVGRPHEEPRKEVVVVEYTLSVNSFFGDFLVTS